MADLRFAWDPPKARSNLRKHGVSFDEATSVFYDSNARLITDPDDSVSEERFILLGVSAQLRILVVVHAFRESEDLVRIISARRATRGERAFYETRTRQ